MPKIAEDFDTEIDQQRQFSPDSLLFSLLPGNLA